MPVDCCSYVQRYSPQTCESPQYEVCRDSAGQSSPKSLKNFDSLLWQVLLGMAKPSLCNHYDTQPPECFSVQAETYLGEKFTKAVPKEASKWRDVEELSTSIEISRLDHSAIEVTDVNLSIK